MCLTCGLWLPRSWGGATVAPVIRDVAGDVDLDDVTENCSNIDNPGQTDASVDPGHGRRRQCATYSRDTLVGMSSRTVINMAAVTIAMTMMPKSWGRAVPPCGYSSCARFRGNS